MDTHACGTAGGDVGSRVVDVAFQGSFSTKAFVPATLLAGTLTVGAAANVERTTVQGSSRDAILINGADVRISDCTIRSNAANGMVVKGADARITGCNFSANQGVAVKNQSAPSVDARNNWWGDPAGPFGASGDGLEGVIVYIPFLTSEARAAAFRSKRR